MSVAQSHTGTQTGVVTPHFLLQSLHFLLHVVHFLSAVQQLLGLLLSETHINTPSATGQRLTRQASVT